MYCSSCGVAVAQGLSYCNYCGATLGGEKSARVSNSSDVKPELLVSAMVAVFVLGLGAIALLIGMMTAVAHFDMGQILGITMLSFLILLLVESVFVWLLLSRKRGAHEPSDIRLLKEQVTSELYPAQAQVLPEPIPSVTEQTTHKLAPIQTERT